MISFIISLEIIIFVKPDPNICVWITASVAAAVNPNDIKTLLANSLSTFPIKGNPVFSNGSKSLPKNPPIDCPIKITSVPFFIAYFNLFKVLYWVIFILKKK